MHSCSLLIALLYGQLNQALIQNTVVVRAELVPRTPDEFNTAGESGRGVRLGLEEVTEEDLKEQLRSTREAVLNRMLIVSGTVLLALSLLAGGVGWHIAGRGLRPLRWITDVARRVADRNLHERIALDGPKNEVKDLADAIDSMLERLERSFHSQQQFIGNASHELKTPLAINRTLIEVALLEDPQQDDRLHHLGTTLLAVNRRHERLIEGLLTLMLSEQQMIDTRPVDLARIAGQVIAAAKSRPEDVDIRAGLDPAECVGDPVLLETVIYNLIDNAIRYNEPEEGWIIVKTYGDDGCAVLVVENPGALISAYEVPGLFEPFARRASTSRQADQSGRILTRGAGLGLSIVRSVIVAHGGTVQAEPREQGGMRVEIRVPVDIGSVHGRVR